MHDRGSIIGLDQPEMVHDAKDRGHVDGAMELDPTLSELLHPAACRCQREDCEQHVCAFLKDLSDEGLIRIV